MEHDKNCIIKILQDTIVSDFDGPTGFEDAAYFIIKHFAQQTHEEICSNDVCDYCAFVFDSQECIDGACHHDYPAGFAGRKLRHAQNVVRNT